MPSSSALSTTRFVSASLLPVGSLLVRGLAHKGRGARRASLGGHGEVSRLVGQEADWPLGGGEFLAKGFGGLRRDAAARYDGLLHSQAGDEAGAGAG